MVISMYFAVSWEEPRMVINESAVEWRDARTGPTDVRATDSLLHQRFSITTFSLHLLGKIIRLSGYLLKTTTMVQPLTITINSITTTIMQTQKQTQSPISSSALKGAHHICWTLWVALISRPIPTAISAQWHCILTSHNTLVPQEVNESPETLRYIWYPELEIYGLETFGRQSVLKEMSGVRIMKNKTINYELGWVTSSKIELN